jgi:uncharacterized membrane protein YhaH (DUF805 family)
MNGGIIDWRELFWSADGRAPRGAFLIGAGTLFLVSVLYEALAGPLIKVATFWFMYPALFWSAACVVSKRLHDRGRSGWWAALVLVALALVWPSTHGVWTVFAGPVLVWSVVELMILPGEQGANRFGPSPQTAAA